MTRARRPVSTLVPTVFTTRGRREANEDRVCALRTLVGGEPALILALADGIGGLPGGGQAAELAIQVLGHYAHYVVPESEPHPDSLRRVLEEAFHSAGRRIWLWARDQQKGAAVGTTLVCCLLWDRSLLVAHAGDSRCYQVTDGGARALTRDHAELGPWPADPERAADEARPLVRRLTNALGWPDELMVEITPPGGGAAGLEEDCVLVVSSDGLHGVLAETDIHEAFQSNVSTEEACRWLASLALERGSLDNISLAAVEVGTLRRARLTWPRADP
jgi:serine/threonine protein phosphatase PrpC